MPATTLRVIATLVQSIGLLATCLLLWLAGPYVQIAGEPVLAPVDVRMMAIAGVVVVWALSQLVKRTAASTSNRQLLKELAADSRSESGAIDSRFAEALEMLKAKSGQKRTRLVLYELPWYIIIGPPGSGKTTVLANSGLTFPLKDTLGSEVIEGIGGTRNCDWWFSEEAVLIDTAGRFTTQDSHEAVDRTGWQRFLRLLKRYRPEQPINGALVTMSLADLMHLTPDEIRVTTAAMQSRLAELTDELGVRFPVYLLFTKCDLVAGFTEFFGFMDERERRQVWGETFEIDANGACDPEASRYGERFDAFLARLNQQLLYRMHLDEDTESSLDILGFPTQLASLREPITEFITSVFDDRRYRDRAPLLRGVYYTSGTQIGTPVDRILGHLARSLGLDTHSNVQFSGRGKSYFISALLSKVIFAESAVAGTDRRVIRRRYWLRVASVAASAAIVGVAVLSWMISATSNRLAVSRMGELATMSAKLAVAEPLVGAEFRAVIEELDLLLKSTDVYTDAGMRYRMGLYQGDVLVPAAELAYETILERKLLPLVAARTEETLIDAMGREDAAGLYGGLKAYLMYGGLHEAAGIAIDADLLAARTEADLRALYGGDPATVDQLLSHHLRLLQTGFDFIVPDQALVSEARHRLTTLPVGRQVLDAIEGTSLGPSGLTLSQVAGPAATTVFVSRTGRDLDSVLIPAFYTRDGYQVVATESREAIRDYAANQWVFGSSTDAHMATQLDRQVLTEYYGDYVDTWSGLLADLDIRRTNDYAKVAELVSLALGRNGAIVRLLETVADQVLIHPYEAVENRESAQRQVVPAVAARFRQYLDLADAANPALASAASGGLDLSVFLDQVFVNRLASTPALGAVIRRIEGTSRDPFGRFRAETRGLPAEAQRWTRAIHTMAWSLLVRRGREELNQVWDERIVRPFDASLKDFYPFSPYGENELPLSTLADFFGAGGRLRVFLDRYLSHFVDMEVEPWKLRSIDGVTLGVSSAALADVHRLERLGRLFFGRNGFDARLRPVVTIRAVHEGTERCELQLGDRRMVHRRGDQPTAAQFEWPPRFGGEHAALRCEGSDGSAEERELQGVWAAFRLLFAEGGEPLPDGLSFRMPLQLDRVGADVEVRLSSDPGVSGAWPLVTGLPGRL